MCFVISNTTFAETFLILKTSEPYMIKNVYWSSCKMSTRYYCQILMKLEFSQQIFLKSSYQILLKSVLWKPNCSMRTDRRTDG